MSETCRIAVVSDIHYASPAEQARGNSFEFRGIENPLLRLFVKCHRHFIWLRRPLEHNHLLDTFLAETGSCRFAVANGDYSCNSAFIGMADEAARMSASLCLAKLRTRFGAGFRAGFGDHELGKVSFVGGRGGMRLASWRCAREELGLDPFWELPIGGYKLMGITSSLVALPVFAADTLPEERGEWERLREEHLAQVRAGFSRLQPHERLIMFCHDPSALPFLLREEAVRSRLGQLELTILGHLHTTLVLRLARLLAGIPRITFLGHTAKRLSTALREARHWRPFRVRLCPSLAGIELLKDGGYLTLELDPELRNPAQVRFHPVPR